MAVSHGDDDLIAAIYDAIVEPSGWNEVVKLIVEATKSVSGGLHIQQVDTTSLSATCNVDPFYAAEYVQKYAKINPINLSMVRIAPGEVWTGTHVTQSDTFKASAYFHEYVRPQGWADAVGVGLLHTPKAVGHLAVQRSPDAIWLEPAEWQLLKTIAPHLKRACDLYMLLSRARAATDSLGAAIATAGFAVFLLTGDCRVVFANAKAEHLVRRGIGLRNQFGRLVAMSSVITARLHALAREAASPKIGKVCAGGTIELSRGENRPPLLAHVIPLAPNRTVAIFDLDRPTAALFVIDQGASFRAQIHRFAASYGLTAAETRVFAEITAGNGLLAAATRLKITELTARSHAKHIFSKTGTKRQTELIRRFFETAYTTARLT
jgi:DNA-binding CsgD family transcriptional regulator